MTICTQGIHNFDATTIGVEVILIDNNVKYKYCSKERWRYPDCVPGCIHRFWYADQIIHSDNSIVVQEYLTVLYYLDKYVILSCPDDFDHNCSRLTKAIVDQYAKIDMSTIAFNQDLDVFDQYCKITAVACDR